MSDGGLGDAGWTAPDGYASDLSRDILSTELTLDVTALTGTARLRVAPDSSSTGASFEARGLVVSGVTDGARALPWRVNAGILDIAVAPGAAPTLVVDYAFAKQDNDMGLALNGAYTLLWPTFCDNLFPCHSDPADGSTFTLSVTGVPAGELAVYAPVIPAPAPAYQLGFVVGSSYAKTDLGTTSAGTRVVSWAEIGYAAKTAKGTVHLRDAFDWYEQTYGPYSFGDEVGTVGVDWGVSGYDGMEHHPLWHVDVAALTDELTHLHEAAHGWYGDGVRIACWEDFVLSEGTVNYISARALGKVAGAAAEQAAFDGYVSGLADAQAAPGPHVARPPGCNTIDPLQYFTDIPYDKGALFFRALAARLGADVVDGVLRDFYLAHVGGAAGMQDLVDFVHAKTGYDASPCATAWLWTEATPTGALATRCP